MNGRIQIAGLAVLLAAVLMAMPGSARAAKALKMEELKVEGQAQKPQVSFILQRSSKINLDVEINRFRPKFSRKTIEQLSEAPEIFEQQQR